jgi:Aspartyl/Asparaginyl beta-hydroxylase
MSYVVKPECVRSLGPIDIVPIKALISRTTDRVWDQEDEHKENKFTCFHHTRHIVFRFIEGMRDHRRFYSNPNWNVWQSRLRPMMNRAILPYGILQPEFPKVMLARLAAGAVIDRHVDGAGSNLYTHKIHIPIETNPHARIIINDRPFHLEEGQAYEVNNLAPHSVENRGSSDRIHLIFEVFDLAEQMAA